MAREDDPDARPKPVRHEVGQDLSALSVEELRARIGQLEEEIARLSEAERAKRQHLAAAADIFRR